MRFRIVLAAPLLLLACSSEPEQPGSVSTDEARQLNEAAAMLDNDSVSVEVLDSAPAR